MVETLSQDLTQFLICRRQAYDLYPGAEVIYRYQFTMHLCVINEVLENTAYVTFAGSTYPRRVAKMNLYCKD